MTRDPVPPSKGRLTAGGLLLILLTAVIAALTFRIITSQRAMHLEEALRSNAALGTFYTFIVIAPEGSAQGILDSMDSLAAHLDNELGFFGSGELRRLNDAGAATISGMSDHLRRVLDISLEAAEVTDSLFDPSLGALVRLWDFGGQPSYPDSTALAEALEVCGLRSLEISDGFIRMAEGMTLDLGAVAKGYVSDQVYALARDRGAQAALVEIGGEVRCGGDPDVGREWSIAVRDPRGDGMLEVIRTFEGAVATSGDYESCFQDSSGNRLCHILDPRTGMPEQGIASVTVTAGTCGMADALATAICVGGVSLAEEIPDSLFMEIIVVTVDRQDRTEVWRRSGAES